MHLDYFAAFCLVVKEKSITKAAHRMHLSQPALSMQINCLENRFGTKLLERTNRGVRLTPAGELLFHHGKRMLAIQDALEQAIKQLCTPENLTYTIAASPTLGTYILPAAMHRFIQVYPNCKFQLVIRPTDTVIENLLDQTISIGLTCGPVSSGLITKLRREKIHQVAIGSNEIIAVAPPGTPWANQRLTLSEPSKLPLLLPSDASGVRRAIEAACAQKNLSADKLNPMATLDNSSAIITAVIAGTGIGLVPRIAVERELRTAALKEIPFDLAIPLPFTLFFADSAVSDNTPEIIEFLIKIF